MTEPLRLKNAGLPEKAVRELENWAAALAQELKSVLSDEGKVSREALTNLASRLTTNFQSLVNGFAPPPVSGSPDSQVSTLSTQTGTVQSVALSAPSIFTVSGSPVTGTGTLSFSLNTQTANRVFAGPSSGGAAVPTFRALVAADIDGLAIGATTQSTGKFTTVDSTSSEYRANGTKVVGAQGAVVADAAGGATVDAEARTAINTLLARVRSHGLIAT